MNNPMPNVSKIWSDDVMIYIQIDTGQIFAEKFEKYPMLHNATKEQRADFTTNNIGIRWENLDEDFSYNGFMTKEKEIIL
jgi:hypothetical protein